MTTPAGDATVITVDPDVPLVRVTREFDAPVHKFFRAHTDPDLFVQWNGPRDHETRIDHHDCRTGGSWRYFHLHNGQEHAFRSCFYEVRPSQLIVQTFTYEGMPDGVALEKLHFEGRAEGRSRLVATSLVDSFAERDAFIAVGMESGAREGYARLDELLAR